MQLFESATPVSAILQHWVPKCNQENERRLRLDFEVPLSEELIDALPEPLKRTAIAVSNLEDGLTEASHSTTYTQAIELYALPDAPRPSITLGSAQLYGLHIYRPTPKEGPSNDLFLTFSTTVRSEGAFGDELVTWALRNLRATIFFKALEIQQELPLSDAA